MMMHGGPFPMEMMADNEAMMVTPLMPQNSEVWISLSAQVPRSVKQIIKLEEKKP